MSDTDQAIITLDGFLRFLAEPGQSFFFMPFDMEGAAVDWLDEYLIEHEVWDFVLTDARHPLDACVVIGMSERHGRMFRLAFNSEVRGPLCVPFPG